jgi:hypothetical protein
VAADDQALYFTTMGFSMTNHHNGRMSMEAAAEHLWGMLIERLQ